jgi:hypothetical protein
MIDFLDQLERDLVEAIDRRHGAAARRRRRTPRIDVVAAAAAIAVAIAFVVVLGSRPETPGAPVKHRTTPTPPPGKVKPIPKGTGVRTVGALARTRATVWSGPARGPGGSGTMTVTGRVEIVRRACCDTPRTLGARAAHVIRVRWVTAGGEFTGCINNTISRRPHGRFVWDGTGRMTTATGVFARFRGRGIGLAGVTSTALTSRARVIVATGAPRGSC